MATSLPAVLFVYTDDTALFETQIRERAGQIQISSVHFDIFRENPLAELGDCRHVVVAGDLPAIKSVIGLAHTHDFSVGIVPTDAQSDLMRFYNLPKNRPAAIDLALRLDAQAMDLILCNDHILLFKAAIGRIPLLDAPSDAPRMQTLRSAMSRVSALKLRPFTITTASDRKIKTAAAGCMIIQHHAGSLASRLIAHDSYISDGMISTVISAPKSVLEYLGFLTRLRMPTSRQNRLPGAVGYIKTPQLNIETPAELPVLIDGERATRTPLNCTTVPNAVRVNVGPAIREAGKPTASPKEIVSVENLPRGKELVKANKQKKVPFFSYASEERFRELFISLREDARLNRIYLVLMVLSTLLATLGLYLNSASVIIGAMLLAPLMAPIVSMAMSLVRGDEEMLKHSVEKIIVGIAIALLASGLMTFLFPHKPITAEMQGRLNPTLLDLGVAIISGIAAAYSKSFREIIQSLAGVAIAVALVPPLAVAGTGLGRFDFHFFFQAFLLFTTNLIGIVTAAGITFRVLGYSPVVRSKRKIGIIIGLLVLISIPLYLSYNRIVEALVYEKSWNRERFLVNDKYIIVQHTDLTPQGGKVVVNMNVLVREPLTRSDLTALRQKIQNNFDRELIIRVRTIYIP